MNTPRTILLLIAVLGLNALATSQRQTWIVDAANGAGANFTDLPAALADPAVQDGDLLLMRPGVYNGTTTSKAVSIVGEPNAYLGYLVAPLVIDQISAGKDFMVSGLDGA